MPTKNKTTYTKANVTEFINSFANTEQKKQDSFKLVELMKNWSGFEPQMWGPTIIGFGNYHYKYASGREGDAPVLGFSPRKAEFSLYVFTPGEENDQLLKTLGKFKITKACIYIKKLDDINLEVLEKLCRSTIQYINEHHECGACRD